ncbi:ABC transporter permease [Thiocapsa bogorovii]|uniref:ABC transporter permease n=1 Tax=Thiocapsa bogorovii TaxID=521689 RepID=UPI001E35D92E|nr:ABC transporter permease [Thiocapsa bogorovii]UHD14675.1 ABC transporter permease [Thiocapsa bogorovii]
MRLANVYRLGLKELISLRYDPVLVFLIIYSFTFAIIAPSRGVKLQLEHASVAVVDEDRSQLSMRLSQTLLPPYFQAPEQIGFEEIDAAMDAGRYTFVIDIPPRLQADASEGLRPAVQVIVDATAMAMAGAGARYLERVLAEEPLLYFRGDRAESSLVEAPAVASVIRLAFNPNGESAWFMSVMQIVNMVTLLGIVLTGAALIREREHGTIEHLLVMPLGAAEIMLAKVWANGLVILIAGSFAMVVVVQGLLGVPNAGSLGLFVLGLGVYLFSITALGILLATLARTMPQFGLLSIPVFLVMYMLSGANTPLDAMPELLQRVMLVSPTTHFVAFIQSVVFRGAGFDLVWTHLAATLGLGAIAFAVALARFRQTVSLSRL